MDTTNYGTQSNLVAFATKLRSSMSRGWVAFFSPLFMLVVSIGLLFCVQAYGQVPMDTEIQTLEASDVIEGDLFGESVAIAGNTTIVGDPVTESVYVYTFNGVDWVETQKLISSDHGQALFNFGDSVAISGNTALVTGHSAISSTGAIYVYRFDGVNWVETQKLIPEPGVQTISSVAIDGNTTIVGAEFKNVVGEESGAAYVYTFNGVDWAETQRLVASDAAPFDRFGHSVAVSGNTAIVGAIWSDAAYVYTLNGTRWDETQKLVAGDGTSGDQFGESVAIDGNTVIVGASWQDGVGIDRGAAYVFTFNGIDWLEEQKLVDDSGKDFDRFGEAVAVEGNLAVVGAPHKDITSNGNEGRAFAYTFDGFGWVQTRYLAPSIGERKVGQLFGASVSISENLAIIGAPTPPVEIGILRPGSAYLFDLLANHPPFVNVGDTFSTLEGVRRFIFAFANDADGDPLTYDWSVDYQGCIFSDPDGASIFVTCDDNGNYLLTLTVSDGIDSTSRTASLKVANFDPSVLDVVAVGPIDGKIIPIHDRFQVTARISDTGTADTHTCTVDFGDGNSQALLCNTSEGIASGLHAYAEAGVYPIVVQAVDDDGGIGLASLMLVAYDPDQGFVTGGGWIDSPAGAYEPDPTLSGKANFGFVSKYKKGAITPTGQTQFLFQAGDLNFHSDTYNWLLVNQGGVNAQYKGTGTINGSLDSNGNPYGFMLWAGDGGNSDVVGDPDTFRIRIWSERGGVEADVYDNGTNQSIDGGSIVIHTGGKGSKE